MVLRMTIIRKTESIATNIGINSDNIENPVAATPSAVETTGLPVPAENLVDNNLVITLPL